MGKEKPGKQNAAANAADNIVQGNDAVPGKVTRAGELASQVGLGNYLSPEDRAKLEERFANRVVAAGARANDAIEAVKIHTLIKKPEDVHWVFGLILDVALTGATSWVTRSLTKFKSGKVKLYADTAHDATMGGNYAAADKADARKALFQDVSDEAIKARIGTVGGFSKFQARPIMARALADSDEKQEKLSYLGQLQRSLDLAYQTMGETAYVGATDAELNVMFEAMDIIHHGSELYQKAVTAKMERYRESGVERIGQDRNVVEGGAKREVVGHEDIDRKVVWVTHEDGVTKSLWFYESSQTHVGANALQGRADASRLTKLVPEEFWDEAIAKSQERHGEAVQTLPDSGATRKARGVKLDYAAPKAAPAAAAPDVAAQQQQATGQRMVRLFGGA